MSEFLQSVLVICGLFERWFLNLHSAWNHMFHNRIPSFGANMSLASAKIRTWKRSWGQYDALDFGFRLQSWRLVQYCQHSMRFFRLA